MHKIVLLVFTFLIFASFGEISAQQSDLNQVGTSMGNFLKIEAGARASAMGGAYVATSNDISSTYWNPGGLVLSEKNETIFQVTNWLADTKYYFFGTSYSLGDLGMVGISVFSFNSGDMEETTLFEPEGTGRVFNTGNISVGLTLSRRFTDHFSAGLSIKYISESIDRTGASTMAIDVGSVFITNFLNNMKIGISLSNLGGRMQLDGSDLSVKYLPENGTKYITSQLRTEPWDLPLLFRFGLATDAYNTDDYRVSISTELVDSRDYEYRLSIGGEFIFDEILALRGGYKFNYDEATLSFGAGLNFQKISGVNLRADYAFNDYGVLNNIHTLSLIFAY